MSVTTYIGTDVHFLKLPIHHFSYMLHLLKSRGL